MPGPVAARPLGEEDRRVDPRTAALETARRHAERFLGSLPDRPVWPRATYPELLQTLGGPLPDGPSDPAEVVERLATTADPGLVAIPGGRFFGFVIGGSLPAALGADWLTSAWDQNAASAALTPAAAAAEQVSGAWILDLLGLPEGCSVGFVTGAQMANFAGLAAARTAVLQRAGWDVAERGLFGAPRIRLLVGADRHGTVDRAARYLGLGRESLVVVESDGEGRMRADALEATLTDATGPTVVALQAGEVHTGAFDPFEPLIAAAHRHDAWVHVDGAFGLWAAASPRTRALTAGMAEADSWTTDAHKTLNVPYDCGLSILRDPTWARATFRESADYLVHTETDPFELTPELSRRARGFPVWAALASLGRSGVASLVDGLCERARAMADGLRGIPGVEVVNDVVFTQVLFRVASDAATVALGTALLEEGTCVVTAATWRGRAVQRCSMSSWATTAEDVERSVEAVRRQVALLA
jgi:glutamate/tyrosine decarboxylase-like PLP-dependent enzyme